MKTAAPLITRHEARERLAFNLRRILDQQGTSCRQVARDHGLCYRVIQRAAAGESDPSWSLIWNLSHALGCQLSDFARPLPPARKKAHKRG